MKVSWLVVFCCFCFSSPLWAQCKGEQFRQFDFWLGHWEVFDRKKNKKAGVNNITKDLNNCIIHEHYVSSTSAYEGKSYNIYDQHLGQWHQTWVDNSGLLLRINGGLADKSMVLQGERRNAEGKVIVDKITWTPFSNGEVRQFWQVSEDGGKNWSTAFDGLYRKIIKIE